MFFIFLLLIPIITYSRVDTGADFLKFIVGARATGFGGAFVGLADDVSTLHYNPAGLCNIEKNEFLFMKSEAIQECGYEYLGFVKRSGEKTGLGFSVLYFHAPEILRSRDNNGYPEIIGTIEYYDLMASISAGRRINDKLSLGGTIKGLHRKISPENGYTGAVDFGVLYNPFSNFKLGIAFQNIGPDIWGDKLPQLAQIGASYKIETLIASFAISHHLLAYSKPEFRVGAEYWYWKGLCLRAGYYFLEGDLKGATLGVGLRLKEWFQCDFAQFPANIANPLQGSIFIRY